jgi:hypothetical protein
MTIDAAYRGLAIAILELDLATLAPRLQADRYARAEDHVVRASVTRATVD